MISPSSTSETHDFFSRQVVESLSLSDEDLAHTVLGMNVQLYCKHEQFENTVDIPSFVTVAKCGLSKSVCVPALYSSAASHIV